MRSPIMIIGLMLLSYACTNYQPKSGNLRRTQPDPGGGTATGEVAASGSQLFVANTKLVSNPGEYLAKISYAGGKVVEVKFTPSGSETKIPLSGVSAGSAQVLTLEIFRDNQIAFIAKKANVSISNSQASNVIIDDCLILTAPWEGKAHDGSCEWTVQDVN